MAPFLERKDDGNSSLQPMEWVPENREKLIESAWLIMEDKKAKGKVQRKRKRARQDSTPLEETKSLSEESKMSFAHKWIKVSETEEIRPKKPISDSKSEISLNPPRYTIKSDSNDDNKSEFTFEKQAGLSHSSK